MMPHHRRFLIASLALMLAFSLSGAAAGQEDWEFDLASADAPIGELSILLTNDDGVEAAGIVALRPALEAAGYDVTMVAPLTDSSGSGTGLKPMAAYGVIDPNGFWVDAPPATCVFVGLTLVLPEPPDLIVSGTNVGTNLGRVVTFSGTVGATFAGVSYDVPGVAFSTGVPDEGELPDHFATVAQFATNLIGALERSASVTGEILPPGTVLNVNYPPLPPEEIKGVRFAVQDMQPSPTVLYYIVDPDDPGMLIVQIFQDDFPAPWPTDRAKYEEGYVTMTLMNADYTVSQEVLPNRARRMLRRLKP